MDNTLSNMCRVCLVRYENEKMCSIFQKDELGMEISQKIAECSGIIINRKNNHPTMICTNCSQSLAISYKFRILCQNSDKELLMFDQGCKTRIELLPNNRTIKSEPTEFVKVNLLNQYEQNSNEFEDNSGSQIECGSPLFGEKVVLQKKKKFKSKSNTVRNTNKKPTPHKEQPMHICEQCGNTYARRCLLTMHMRRHSNIKRFECELCEKKFQTQSEMARHMRTHTGVKPYMCRFCGRKFADRSTNIKHERTHTNERPFVCETCGKSFTYSNVLKNHILTHTGEKNFKCKPCDKTFSRAHQLKQHFGTLTHQQTLLKSKCPSLQSIIDTPKPNVCL